MKKSPQRGGSAPEPLFASEGYRFSAPRPSRCHFRLLYNFAEFVSSARVLLPSKKKKITAVNVLLIPYFCIYFSIQTL